MNNRISENTMKFRSVGLTLTKFVLLLLTCVTVYTHADSVTKGYVYSRGVVEEDDGTKYWAEYNPETGRLENHFPATDTYALDKTLLISGLQYRAYVNRWEDIKKTYKDAEILNGGTGEEHPPVKMATAKLLTEQFKILQPESADPNVPTPEPITFTFTVNDIETSVDAYDINDDVRHVILRPPVFKDTEQQGYQYFPILNNSGEIDVAAVKRHIILAQMPINPDEVIAENTLSLLVSSNTEEMNKRVVKESPHNIGLLTSFVNGVEGAEEYDGEDYLGIKYGIQRNNETEFTNPIQDAHISTYGGMGFEFHDLTDEDGKWGIVFAGWIGGPPCWIMTDMYSPIQIEMYSKSFNPRLRRGYPYYVQMPHYLPCNGNHPLTHLRAMSIATSGGLSGAMAGVNLIALAATSTTPIIRMDYIMDMKILAGQAELSNEHLSRDATQDIYSPIDRRSEVLDPATQAQWAASGWDKSISVSDSTPTEYRVDAVDDAEYKIVQQNFDLDGDGEKDTVKIGQFNCKTPAEDGGQDQDRLVDRTEKCTDAEVLEFKVNEAATNESKIAIQTVKDAKNSTPPAPYYQAIYYSASAAEEGDDQQQALPDIVRLLDDAINDYHQGLLKVISEDDLRNTDIYVFRESSGDLLAERSGLAYRDLSAAEETTDTTNFDVDETNFHYRLQMRGGVEGASRISGRYGRTDANGNYLSNSAAFERWQNLSGMNPKFYEREADHIRPGEPVKIVAINRATGYIGTAKTVLDIKDSIYTVPSIRVPKIKMGPPNLKIWAERELKVEYGLTKDEDRNYLIGSEGGAETDDVVIKVYTEWLDQDGSALPEQLKDFGYTARLGKLTGENTIENYNVSLLEDGSATTAGQSVRYFPINPGKNLQLIRVSEANAGTQHLYVQVNGESYLRNPDFSGDPAINIEINNNDNRANNPVDFDSLGAGSDQLQYRPKHFVPILTPIWDENSTLENKLYFKQWEIAQEAAAAANNGTATDELNPFKPGAAYKWRYRPEYQFTVYDLNVRKLDRVRLDESGNEVVDEILDISNPTLASTDNLIKFIYSLTDQVANPISLFSGETKELVLALGEEEFVVDFGEDKTISIDNISHLTTLDFEDYLTLRLYTNNDASNLLWEYAFEYIYIATQHEEYDSSADRIYVSADVDSIPLQALLVGYVDRDPSIKEPITADWILSGTSGSDLLVDREVDEDLGSFFNELILPSLPIKGSVANVSIKLDSDDDKVARLQPIEILAGQPASITVQTDPGSHTSAGGYGTIGITITVRDQFGNRVEDGTGVDIIMDADGFVENYDDPELEYEGITVNGQVKARIRGGFYPGDFEYTVKTVNYTEQVPYTVHPLYVDIQTPLADVLPTSTNQLSVLVTDYEGYPVENAQVRAWGKSFIVDDTNAITNQDGVAVISVTAGAAINLEAEVKAQVAFEPPAVMVLPIRPGANQNRFEGRSNDIVIVGDKTEAGYLQYVRYDDTGLNIPYEVSSQVTYTGSEGEQLQLELGSLLKPNHDPLATYYIRDVYTKLDPDTGEINHVTLDSTRGTEVIVENVAVSSFNSPIANTSSSGFFDGTGIIHLENVDALKPSSPGVTLSFDAASFDSSGVLYENGPLRIEYGNYAVTASVYTADGVFQTNSPQLVNGWHSVGVKIHDGKLYLQVDDSKSTPVDISGDFTNVTSPSIGRNFEGFITNVKIFDYASPSLLTFDDATTTKTILFTSDTLTQEVSVVSTGQLNLASGGSSAQATVPLVSLTEGQMSLPINLLSSSTYVELAGLYILTTYQGDEVPEINMAALENPSMLQSPLMGSSLFPQAHAISFSDIGSGFVSAFSTAVSFFLPIEEIKVIYEQVGYAIAGDPNFDPVKLAINTVGILTYLPGVGYLAKPIYKPVKAIFRLGRSKPKAMKAVAGSVMKLVDKVKKSKSVDPVLSLLPFFLVAAEMYWEDPESIKFMLDAIESDEDLWAWIDFFNIPDDWNEDDEGLPGVEISGLYNLYNNQSPLDGLFSNAYAAGGKVRMKGQPFAKSVAKVADDLPNGVDPKEVSKALNSMKALKDTYFGSLRAVVKDPKFIAGSAILTARSSAENLKKFLTGASDSRVHPALFIGMVTFLEVEAKEGRLEEHLHDEVIKLYLKVLSSLSTRYSSKSKVLEFKEEDVDKQEVCNKTSMHLSGLSEAADVLTGGGHGAMFHLSMVTYYHLITNSEFAESLGDDSADGFEIKAIEGARRVWVFGRNDAKLEFRQQADVPKSSATDDKILLNILRYVDIVLADAGNTNLTNDEYWVELKSYRARDGDNTRKNLQFGGLNRWKIARGKGEQCKGSGLHKQFTLDRIATNLNVRSTLADSGDDNYRRISVKGMKWWFQKFKVDVRGKVKKDQPIRTDRSPKLGSSSYSEDGSIRNYLTLLPLGKSLRASINLFNEGDDPTKKNITYKANANNASFNGDEVVDLASPGSLLIDAMFTSGLIPGDEDFLQKIKDSMPEPD
ncbi:hypothetical protein QFX18_10415 [Saccharophagus degradans]|uniref:hypothetical protein n=1 Tax=Saccharophagus degradans TaxID=86304 RepID=UPI002478078C|nr:hypothetical protein [Saccharophagus degradans]WGP00457.1 hypothetical protein QFX18_10415 [Saccharophagus degradans]